MLQGDLADLTFIIGNRHKVVQNPKKSRSGEFINAHNWTAFVKLKNNAPKGTLSKLISKVRFGLHESFGVDHREVKT